MSIKERRVIERHVIVSDIGSHYHLELFCPMVQDPQGAKYYIGMVEKANGAEILINGKWYKACTCVDPWFNR